MTTLSKKPERGEAGGDAISAAPIPLDGLCATQPLE